MKECSLVLCGMMSDDSRSAVVPVLAAERLNWPLVSRVLMKADQKSVTVRREGRAGSRLIFPVRFLPSCL